jgi:hypothetical protein
VLGGGGAFRLVHVGPQRRGATVLAQPTRNRSVAD